MPPAVSLIQGCITTKWYNGDLNTGLFNSLGQTFYHDVHLYSVCLLNCHVYALNFKKCHLQHTCNTKLPMKPLTGTTHTKGTWILRGGYMVVEENSSLIILFSLALECIKRSKYSLKCSFFILLSLYTLHHLSCIYLQPVYNSIACLCPHQ